MTTKQTAVEWLIEQVKSKEWQDKFIWHKEEVFEQAKAMEREQEFETKAYWFGRGILASKENRVDELKPKK
jgi:hypothetical protein